MRSLCGGRWYFVATSQTRNIKCTQKQGVERPLVGGQSNKRPRGDQQNAIQGDEEQSGSLRDSWELFLCGVVGRYTQHLPSCRGVAQWDGQSPASLDLQMGRQGKSE